MWGESNGVGQGGMKMVSKSCELSEDKETDSSEYTFSQYGFYSEQNPYY